MTTEVKSGVLWSGKTLVRVEGYIGWLNHDGWERVELDRGQDGVRLLKIYPDGRTDCVPLWELDR